MDGPTINDLFIWFYPWYDGYGKILYILKNPMSILNLKLPIMAENFLHVNTMRFGVMILAFRMRNTSALAAFKEKANPSEGVSSFRSQTTYWNFSFFLRSRDLPTFWIIACWYWPCQGWSSHRNWEPCCCDLCHGLQSRMLMWGSVGFRSWFWRQDNA